MSGDERDRNEAWVIAAKLGLVLVPFILLLAFFALYRWVG